eukprot:CAMPEP_0202809700 /NCGR_PEP_ID=MMETSP1389-20130828/1967_1 /ASSEMBLY_ACC=CAM_ASM_000865 /TAXON_ID=302021 /ORGANISM="Rhodomonas sp., Strain CCMP768" /LENGTH=47 /DNA_ID= /DNA_START= /DNA_END= /DNA_ORIENTATION=
MSQQDSNTGLYKTETQSSDDDMQQSKLVCSVCSRQLRSGPCGGRLPG